MIPSRFPSAQTMPGLGVLFLWGWLLAFWMTPALWLSSASAADTDQAKKLFRTGDYQACIEMSKEEVARSVWNELWPRMLIESYLTTGKYAEALTEYEAAIQKFSTSLRMRLLGAQVYRMNNLPQKANEQLEVIPALLERTPWRYSGKDELVPLGEFFLTQGEDPKQVLEVCYDRALKSDPKLVEAHIASAKLALAKFDQQVAAESLKKAVKLDENDPEIHYLLAKTWSSSDHQAATEHLAKALEINPKHLPSLLYQVENRLDAEDYLAAERLLKKVEEINPKLPLLWAHRSAIAHFEARHAEEGEFRRKALLPWALNPEVDYTIGKQLSEHYRFAEAVTYVSRAVEMDRKYLPAKTQLAQDLLRLGRTDLGWKLVDQVRKEDPYDVSIFNLKQLEGQLNKFATLEGPGFVVRMDSKEAKIYGDEVLALLADARKTLTEKYEVQLQEPIYVEIFPRQKDFAIRTFGMPGGSGFLGVCFGQLITANSPAALRVDSNWKSVLWHEYCHVVTLQKTKNKMPRWLSEGISVYEERQKDSRWGQLMTPTYRNMVVGDDLVPVSQLSGAFMQPKSPMHLQFAYYQSSMVVEYWVQKYGMASLKRVLNDLSVGMPVNQALARDAASIDALDQEFESFFKNSAETFVAVENADEVFEAVKVEDGEPAPDWPGILKEKPRNYWALSQVCRSLIQSKRWDEALSMAIQLQDIYPDDREANGLYALMARIHRGRDDREAERSALVELTKRCPDCKEALMRLIEIDQETKSWDAVADWCQKSVEIDPLRPGMQESRALAAEALNRPAVSVSALQALLELGPIDPAGVQYRLAQGYQAMGEPVRAKRHLLQALEESPRYRAALKLLVELQSEKPSPVPEVKSSEPPPDEGTTKEPSK